MSVSAPELHRAPAGPGLGGRLRQGRFGIVVAAAFLALLVVMIVASADSDTTPMSTRNASAQGTRALAQILGDHGVAVREIDAMADARIVDPEHTTVVVSGADLLMGPQLDSLADYPGDLVLLGATDPVLASLGLQASIGTASLGGTAAARCEDPDATAAERITVGTQGISDPGPDVELCFLSRDGVASMARAEIDGRTVTVITADVAFTNAELDQHGNAALALRTTGRHPDVVWYVADILDPTLLTWQGSGEGDGALPPDEIEAHPDFLPPGTGSAFYALALALVFLAIWRGRRFGALIREPLPVVVRASESVRGRARLYRRVRASGRAGSALRAAAALRMGRRIGVPRTAEREALVAALVRATGRPEHDIVRVLYGPPPHDDAALMTLIHELDALESEVHRP